MADSNIAEFVRWGASDPRALADQMRQRVHDTVAEGGRIGVINVVIKLNERGNAEYIITNTGMPAEVMLMAAHELVLKVNSARDE